MDDDPKNDAKALGHEPIETNVRAVGKTGVALAVVIVVAFVITFGLMKFYAAFGRVVPGAQVSEQVPRAAGTPKLDPVQPLELHNLRAAERRMLDTYGWTDRAAGVARIPIAEAMKIIAEQGLPQTLPQPANDAAAQPEGGGRP